MSAIVQSLVVFGHVYFINQNPNTTDFSNFTLIANTDRKIEGITGIEDALRSQISRRTDYVYTPGIGGHKIHTQAATWNTARKICLEEGGHLAIINSVTESEIIAHLAKASKPHFGSEDSNYVAIGFHDLYQNGEYVTIHGESLATAGFDSWYFEQPSKGIEHCGSIHSADGKLNDIACTAPFGFVCELPYVPEEVIQPQ